MKKIAFCVIATCLLLTFHPLQSNAITKTASSSLVVSKTAEAAEANVLLLRLNEINDMDKSNLMPPDKKKLREEVRSIIRHLRDLGDGVYISVGAIIIIVLLLIILF